jgi:UDP-glucuronate 4-epimerase
MECLPSNLYGATKKANELVAAAYCETDKINAIGLRFFSVYGPNGRPDMFLTSAIAKAKLGQPITLFCDDGDDMLRDWTHISDITAGIILSVDSDLTGHHVFNLAAANPVSVVKTAVKIKEHYQSDGLLLAAGRQAGEISFTRGNIDKAKNILGYFPLIPFQDGLAQLLAAEN